MAEKRSNFCTRDSKKQMQRVLYYQDFLREQAELHDLALTSVSSYEDQRIHYSLGPGNNRPLLKEAMARRWWWREADARKGHFVNLLWSQLKDPKFIAGSQGRRAESSESLEEGGGGSAEEEVASRTLHNHFARNKYLGSKLSLYLSLREHCRKTGAALSDVLLPTFFVRRFMDEEWKCFTKAYF